MTPRLLDLFCCQGGAGMGYHRAGFEVVGVDIAPQPRYPFEFHQADALEYLAAHGNEFDAIHASPPCQAFTKAQAFHGRQHPELIAPTRELLIQIGKPWVIENVVGAPMRVDLMLCGSMFGLGWDGLVLNRHRWFEVGGWELPALSPASCQHDAYSISVFGNSVLGRPRNGMKFNHPNERERLRVAEGRTAMGIDWMTRSGLSEAVPPAYTEYIGKHLLASLEPPPGRAGKGRRRDSDETENTCDA